MPSHQGVILHGNPHASAQRPRQKPGLIEASLSQSPKVERNGEDNIDFGCSPPALDLDEQVHQRRDPLELTAEFQGMNPLSHHPGVGNGGASRIEGGKPENAVTARVIPGVGAL